MKRLPCWAHNPETPGSTPGPATTPRRVNRTGAPGLLAKQIVLQGMGFECSTLRSGIAGTWIVDLVGCWALVRSEMEPRGLGFKSSAIRVDRVIERRCSEAPRTCRVSCHGSLAGLHSIHYLES